MKRAAQFWMRRRLMDRGSRQARRERTAVVDTWQNKSITFSLFALSLFWSADNSSNTPYQYSKLPPFRVWRDEITVPKQGLWGQSEDATALYRYSKLTCSRAWWDEISVHIYQCFQLTFQIGLFVEHGQLQVCNPDVDVARATSRVSACGNKMQTSILLFASRWFFSKGSLWFLEARALSNRHEKYIDISYVNTTECLCSMSCFSSSF